MSTTPGGPVDVGPSGTATRASDAVVAEIEHDISTGVLEVGRPIPAERDLVGRFKTSRAVVREAIATLSNRGLVECRPRCRPIVRDPGYAAVINAVGGVLARTIAEPGGAKNLYWSRVFLERALVREAAVAARKVDIEALRDALVANERAIADSMAFYATDIAFHGVLYGIPRNPIFTVVHDAFVNWLSPHWGRMPQSPERNLVNFKSHEGIYLAIVERDPDAAEEALINHLSAAWEYVRVTLEDETPSRRVVELQ